ncbi:MAG: hypothetical protein GY877_07105, partial [Hyphomicrobium sp.]|nr:hypothetical protein [Hyphomicrobium sp.]
ANAGLLNVTADNLSLRADSGLIGGSDTGNINADANSNAIDITVSTLAVSSDSGIYLSETDDVTVTTVDAVAVDIESVVRVNFNSTTDGVSADRTMSSLEGLSTDTDGPIKLVSQAGSLTIGSGGPGVSVGGAGDVLLEAAQNVFANAAVVSGTGNITLDAGNDLAVNAAVMTGGSGTL